MVELDQFKSILASEGFTLTWLTRKSGLKN